MRRWLPVGVSLAILCTTPAPVTASVEPLEPARMDSVVFLETVGLPTPGEFFTALDKVSRPNWAKSTGPRLSGESSKRELLALQLGILLADGFAAIQARDGQGVKNTGVDILNLTKRLNLEQGILPRARSIGDFSSDARWDELREELDATQNDVRLAMLQQKDDDLLVFITAGSWVRQMDIALDFVAADYKPQAAELLDQPAVAGRLLEGMRGLPRKEREEETTKAFLAGIEQARGIMERSEPGPPGEEAVVELAGVMSGLVESVSQPAPAVEEARP
jgi:hypothetical protein